MRIILIGYGKMGKLIEKIAIEKGHEIVAIFDAENSADLKNIQKGSADVAIEFSQPATAYENVSSCLKKQIPVISGTTGWMHQLEAAKATCKQFNGTFLYASNFSLGVNLFFKINELAAKIMERHKQYAIQIEEIHHTQKLDAPSGTAITLAEGILAHNDWKSHWTNHETDDKGALEIVSKREGEVPGTHSVIYKSDEDTIFLKHEAHSRGGFALGAVLVAEWIRDKKGYQTMDSFLGM
jgi:4-hydroxy-tetrahydrodipicolinate reductase